MLHAIDREHSFFKGQLVVRLWQVAADATGKIHPKTIDPETDRFAAYNHATFAKQILNIRRADREPMASPGNPPRK